jgi:hypothetical protein
MASFIVNKSDLRDRLHVQEQLECICISKKETDEYIIFEAKPGFLVSMGTMLTENKISYQLEFEQEIIKKTQPSNNGHSMTELRFEN